MSNYDHFDMIFQMDYDRICDGEHLNMVNKPFTKLYVTQMEEYFKSHEEYEKCEVINAYSKRRFPHGLLWTVS